MMNSNGQTSNHIPVRFVDEEPDARPEAPTAAELGRASSYEDETEIQRRIDRGREQPTTGGHSEADDRDTAGGPHYDETPERREDLDTRAQASAASMDAAEPIEIEAIVLDEPTSGAAYSAAELLAAQGEVRILEAELQRLKGERQELRELVARRQADFENSRKRFERERSETYQRVVADVVKQLLPVVDNLRRALDAEASVEATESEEFRHFLSGIELIARQLNGVLEKLGIEPVATVGQPFDPHVHEAIATEPSAEFAPDTVVQEVQRGYRLGDKLIRPAMVKVAIK